MKTNNVLRTTIQRKLVVIKPHTALKLFVLLVMSPIGSAYAEATQADKQSAPIVWCNEFFGEVTIYRIDWRVDREGNRLPQTIAVTALELRRSKTGYERAELGWSSPYRDDLTPEFTYKRWSGNEGVQVEGNSLGSNAVVFERSQFDYTQTYLYRMLNLPQLTVCNETDARCLDSMTWSASPSVAVHDPPVVPAYAGKSDWLEATQNGVGSIPGGLQTASADRTVLQCRLANDVFSVSTDELVSSVKMRVETPETSGAWAGAEHSAYCVHQWQTMSDSKSGVTLFPRIITWRQDADHPKMIRNNYYHRVVALVLLRRDEGLELSNWRHLLPELHVSDIRTNEASLETTPLSECIATQQVVRANDYAKELLNLLCDNHDVKFRQSPVDPERTGTLKPAFEALKDDEEVAALRQLLAQESADTGDSETGAVVSVPPNETADAPKLLHLVDFFRNLEEAAEEARSAPPARAGFVPVSRQQMAEARKTVLAVQLGLGCILLLTIALSIRHWRFARHALPTPESTTG